MATPRKAILWPSAHAVARLIVAACRFTDDNPLEIESSDKCSRGRGVAHVMVVSIFPDVPKTKVARMLRATAPAHFADRWNLTYGSQMKSKWLDKAALRRLIEAMRHAVGRRDPVEQTPPLGPTQKEPAPVTSAPPGAASNIDPAPISIPRMPAIKPSSAATALAAFQKAKHPERHTPVNRVPMVPVGRKGPGSFTPEPTVIRYKPDAPLRLRPDVIVHPPECFGDPIPGSGRSALEQRMAEQAELDKPKIGPPRVRPVVVDADDGDYE